MISKETGGIIRGSLWAALALASGYHAGTIVTRVTSPQPEAAKAVEVEPPQRPLDLRALEDRARLQR